MRITTRILCPNCGWYGVVDIYPSTPDSHDEPGTSAEVDPSQCPQCDDEFDPEEAYGEYLDDDEGKREDAWEAKEDWP